MSTRHIRAVVGTALDSADRHILGAEALGILDNAMKEVEAIERAAKALRRWNMNRQPLLDVDAARAWSTIESIAKDAT